MKDYMENEPIKIGTAAMFAIISYLTKAFTTLFFIMVIFEMLDYTTGIIAAVYKGEGVSGKIALWGFIKKVCYFILVGVAFLFDLTIIETINYFSGGHSFEPIFGVMAICYLLSTEAISILENLLRLNVYIPFLTKALKMYKDKVEKKGGKHNEQ